MEWNTQKLRDRKLRMDHKKSRSTTKAQLTWLEATQKYKSLEKRYVLQDIFSYPAKEPSRIDVKKSEYLFNIWQMSVLWSGLEGMLRFHTFLA